MKQGIFKILAIENNSLLYSLLKILLNHPELSLVGHARNAMQALGILAEQPADVVIIDISLPDMCGLDLVPLVLHQVPKAKVIVLTDDNDLRYRQAALDKGAHACLKKTRIANDLLPLLKQVLETTDSSWRVIDETEMHLARPLQNPLMNAGRTLV